MSRFHAWLFIAALAASSCSRAAPPNILVIVVDTLRADRVGVFGNPRGLTPFIDALAARSNVFKDAYAASSWTNPSVASILTSRYQSQHGIVTFHSVLAEQEVTLPEILKTHGYATGGFSANGLLAKKFGFGQGYDEYQAVMNKGDELEYVPKRAEELNQNALKWLDGLGPGRPPVFLYLQYMETHTPYRPSEDSLRRVFADRERPDFEEVNTVAHFGNVVEFDDAMLANIRDTYDATVLTLDQQIRELFAQLQQRGFLDHAVVVITADHGDEFRDHGLMGHSKSLYNEVIHVPLIIAVPGQTEGKTIGEDVSLVDLAPTLLDVIHVPAPPSFVGSSLTPLMTTSGDGWLRSLRRLWPAKLAPRVAFSELLQTPEGDGKRFTPHERSVVDGTIKLIAGAEGEREYYDLVADAAERQPAGVNAEHRQGLDHALATFRAQVGSGPAPNAAGELDPETRERMRALGYAQ